MSHQDRIIALIRTGVPALVGALLAFIVAKIPGVAALIHTLDGLLAASGFVGVSVTVILQAIFVAIVVAAYYWLARRIGGRWPAAERWLLGHSATPIYAHPVVPPASTEIIAGTTLTPNDPPHYGS